MRVSSRRHHAVIRSFFNAVNGSAQKSFQIFIALMEVFIIYCKT